MTSPSSAMASAKRRSRTMGWAMEMPTPTSSATVASTNLFRWMRHIHKNVHLKLSLKEISSLVSCSMVESKSMRVWAAVIGLLLWSLIRRRRVRSSLIPVKSSGVKTPSPVFLMSATISACDVDFPSFLASSCRPFTEKEELPMTHAASSWSPVPRMTTSWSLLSPIPLWGGGIGLSDDRVSRLFRVLLPPLSDDLLCCAVQTSGWLLKFGRGSSPGRLFSSKLSSRSSTTMSEATGAGATWFTCADMRIQRGQSRIPPGRVPPFPAGAARGGGS
mmetsp:Transcript_32997/g.105110  ORF Transcript_32997/g.105110 Transcript_32997/m.105110 type:complete len:275 (-) Transcript_32997:71-895(-)